jgi:hypothetical protein
LRVKDNVLKAASASGEPRVCHETPFSISLIDQT